MDIRRPGKLKILSSFAAFIFLAISPTCLCSKEPKIGDELNQPISISGRKSDNAAFYYSKAFELLKFPESGDLKKDIYAIVENGWLHEYREVKRLLQENASCLQEFIKGTELVHCDFDFGHKPQYLIEKDYPLPTAYTLFTMVELQARNYEKQHKFDKAVDLYLASIAYARHLSRDSTSLSKVMGYAIGRGATEHLEVALEKNQFEKRQCPEIISHLDAYDIPLFLKELHEATRDEMKSLLKKTADLFMISAAEKFRDDPGILSKAVLFRKDYIARAYRDIDYYYGNYIRAFETHEKQDWDFAVAEAEKYEKKAKLETTGNTEGNLLGCFLKDPDNPNPQCAQRIRFVLAGNIMIYDGIIAQHDETYMTLQKVRTLAESRCH